MMVQLFAFEIDSLPVELDPRRFIASMLNSQFMLYHDLKSRRTFLITEDIDAPGRLQRTISGISLHEEALPANTLNASHYAVGYASLQPDKEDKPNEILESLYSMLGGTDSFLIISFVPASANHVEEVRRRIENISSSRSIRLTKNLGNKNGLSSTSDSMQMELFHDSDERKMLLLLLDSLNDAAMKNGTAYNISLIFNSRIAEYLKSRLFLFEDRRIMIGSIEEAYKFCRGADSLPFSHSDAAAFLTFSERINREQQISTWYKHAGGEIEVGEYLHGSLTRSSEPILLDYRTFNLGTVISGLPGTGKTAAAMNILKQIHNSCKTSLVVLSPTEEWNSFAKDNEMKIVSLYSQMPRINFFKCDSKINIERFYENLAMLIASASSAGPYKNSLEKSLLSAFRKTYASTRSPDPLVVYEEIENAVIEQHGKRTHVGVKYTKHGENVMAALQNLRLMLMKPQFAYPEGENFSHLIKDGTVFDLSSVSNNMKPFFYALILNQIYSFTDMFDAEGNDKLRMLICIEEAQLLLDAEERSAANVDLEQRIQDFRKKGIGLMLVAHSITDISIKARRLCQTKLYFRQSSDVAKYACNDLVFREEESKAVIDKLKSLQQGKCALNHIAIENGLRIQRGSVFMKAAVQQEQAVCNSKPAKISSVSKATKVKILDVNGNPKSNTHIQLYYVGEQVYQGITDPDGTAKIDNLMEDRIYTLLVLGAKKKDAKRFEVVGGREVSLPLDILTNRNI